MEPNAAYSGLWSPREVAAYLGVSKSQIFRMIEDSAIPVIRLSPRVVRFDPEAIREWWKSRETPVKPSNGGGAS